jgi:predicted PurR-regulated permease PerM
MSRNRESRRISFLIFYGTVILLGWLAYRIVEPFLVQIGWAVVLAICLDPIQSRLRPRLGPTRTALLLTALVVVLLVLPVAFAGAALAGEGQQAVTDIRTQLQDEGGAAAWLHTGWEWLRARLPFLPPEDEVIAWVTASLGNVAGFMASRAGGLLAGAAAFVFNLFITLGILFFLLRDSDGFASGLRRLLPFDREQNERLLDLTRDLVSASVTATLAISASQGLIGGLTFWILDLRAPAVWGLVMGVLAFLPLVGATIVWLPASLWLILSGSYGKGVALLLVGALVMGNVDNVIRPLLLSGRSRMNTLTMIISLLGGVSAFGFIGIVLGPLVAAMITALAESYVRAPEPPSAARKPPGTEIPSTADGGGGAPGTASVTPGTAPRAGDSSAAPPGPTQAAAETGAPARPAGEAPPGEPPPPRGGPTT